MMLSMLCRGSAPGSNNPKANLGMGTVQCTKENFDKLTEIIQVLLNLDAVFLEEQRQEFNLFAIVLRKSKRYNEALTFYKKALQIYPNDETCISILPGLI